MRADDNWSLYVIVAIVAVHFIIGIGYLIYKIAKAPSSSSAEEQLPDSKSEPR